jgi:hypothetical protein
MMSCSSGMVLLLVLLGVAGLIDASSGVVGPGQGAEHIALHINQHSWTLLS